MIVEIIPKIVGIELASFLDKKSNVNDCIQFGGFFWKKIILGTSGSVIYEQKNRTHSEMIFKISWAADPSWSGIVWFRSGMVPSCHINYQKFGEFMFGKIITKKLILTSNFSSVLFRHTRSRQTFDT